MAKSTIDCSVPVVLLDTDHYGAIGIARSLGRLSIPVYCVDSNPKTISFHSRYCKGGFNYNGKINYSEMMVHYLLEVAKKIGKPSVLIPTTDDAALLSAEYFDSLKKCYIYHQVSPKIIKSVANKKEMYFLAKSVGIPTAETNFPQSRKDVEEFLETASFPIMLKAIDGRALLATAGHKMFITNTKEEILSLYEKFETPSHPNFMLQEFIPGKEDSVWMFNGYFNANSECLFGATGKKIRQSPVYTGSTSLGICLKNRIVQELTKKLIKEIGYKGIVDIGYRYDNRDGKYKVLDINPRIGQTFRLFVGTQGLDVARSLYFDLTNQIVPSNAIFEGRKWIVEDKDLISSIRYMHDKKLKVLKWLESFRGIQESAWFATDDPLPFLLMCQQFLARSVEHLLRLSSNKNNQPFWDHFGTTP